MSTAAVGIRIASWPQPVVSTIRKRAAPDNILWYASSAWSVSREHS